MNPRHAVASLAGAVRAGGCVFCAWVGFPEPAVAEQLVRDGFDAAVLDMQHGAFDVASAIRGIAHVALAGKPAIIRIPVGDFATASRMLDMGAAGIIAPMVNTIADAKAFAAFTKFPPVGERSWGPRRVLSLLGSDVATYLQSANSLHLSIAMIETREAMAALDDILAVAGIDGVFVGPSDLSIALSEGRQVDAAMKEVDDALDKVRACATAHNKFAAVFCANGERARALKKRGFSLCSVSTDALLMRQAALSELAIAKG